MTREFCAIGTMFYAFSCRAWKDGFLTSGKRDMRAFAQKAVP